jgi:hypothetical protein
MARLLYWPSHSPANMNPEGRPKMPYDQDRLSSDLPPSSSGAFAVARAAFQRTAAEIPAFGNAHPSSPDAYNALSKLIMGAYLDAVDQIDALGVPYHHNLGLALFIELHTRACYHYFREYDRLQGLTEIASPEEIRRSKRSFSDLIGAARRRLPNLSLGRRHEWDVAFSGTSTFTWPAFRRELAPYGIALRNGATGKPLSFPRSDVQAALLRAWVHTIHTDMARLLGVSTTAVERYGPDPVGPLLKRVASTPTLSDSIPDLLVTGTLGELRTRLTALSAMARGVPVLTIHHGAQYMIWDEPYYELYEGFLPDYKLVYGAPVEQNEAGAFTSDTNVRGTEIQLYSRTDKTINRIYAPGTIEPLATLNGKSVLYLASEFESVRYGPFRDVHPSIYLSWQQQLLSWISSRTGNSPRVRLHPKRPSTHFDPLGFPLDTGDLFEAIEEADVLVVDYPTTSLPMAAATSKPVLYFDLGIRRLFPAATAAIEDRCIVAPTDMQNPSAGFATMQANLAKACKDTFTPLFSLAPNSGDEVADSAKAIAHALAIR